MQKYRIIGRMTTDQPIRKTRISYNVVREYDSINEDEARKKAMQNNIEVIQIIPQERILREATLEGVVCEFDRGEAEVILAVNEKEEKRVMKAKELRDAGVWFEGQGFYLKVIEYKEGNKEVIIYPCDDPSKIEVMQIRPNLDLSKFRRLG